MRGYSVLQDGLVCSCESSWKKPGFKCACSRLMGSTVPMSWLGDRSWKLDSHPKSLTEAPSSSGKRKGRAMGSASRRHGPNVAEM